jgi:hypothetical protein
VLFLIEYREPVPGEDLVDDESPRHGLLVFLMDTEKQDNGKDG